MFSLKTSMFKNINVFQTSPNTNFSPIILHSYHCIQEFRDYVQSTLLYSLRVPIGTKALEQHECGYMLLVNTSIKLKY